MMNQDQYHASLLNSGQPIGLGWDGITKASQPKVFPVEPPNNTDIDETIKQVRNDKKSLVDVNWNNIKVTFKPAERFKKNVNFFYITIEYFRRKIYSII